MNVKAFRKFLSYFACFFLAALLAGFLAGLHEVYIANKAVYPVVLEKTKVHITDDQNIKLSLSCDGWHNLYTYKVGDDKAVRDKKTSEEFLGGKIDFANMPIPEAGVVLGSTA
jgi:hypothetical protein